MSRDGLEACGFGPELIRLKEEERFQIFGVGPSGPNPCREGGAGTSGGGWDRREPERGMEMHVAIETFGSKDRTSRLSDDEFNAQLVGEVRDRFSESARHFENGVSMIFEYFRRLFA